MWDKITIRTRLIVINILVTSTILWLTISFWTDAYRERLNAAMILQTVEIDRQMLSATHRFSLERERFSVLLGRSSPIENKTVQSLTAHARHSHEVLTTLDMEVNRILTDGSLNDRLIYPVGFLEKKLVELKDRQQYLSVYQNYATEQLLLSRPDRDPLINRILFESYTEIIGLVEEVSTFVQIQPIFQMNGFADLQSLRKTIWNNNQLTLLQATILSSHLAGSLEVSDEDSHQLLLIEEKINNSREVVENYKHKTYQKDQIKYHIDMAFAYFDFNYDMAKNRLISALETPELGYFKIEDWSSVVAQLSQYQNAINKAIDNELQTISSESYARGFNRLVIDTLIVIISLLVAIISLSITRKIKHQAYHDDLTGLPNRIYFESKLNGALAVPGMSESVTVIYVDINKLQSINDTFGQKIGDYLIDAVSSRLVEGCEPGDFLARMGGDEFAVICKSLGSPQYATERARKLVNSLHQEFSLGGLTIRSSASAGFATYPEDGNDTVELIRNAKIALFQAKNHNSGKVVRYDRDMALLYQRRVQTEIELKKAIELNQLELYYQPKTCVKNSNSKHMEALVRWNHPERGLIPPGEFIPIAEGANLMGPIGNWILNEACRQIAAWKNAGMGQLSVAVNISAQQFHDNDFFDTVVSTLARHNVESRLLELEITESIVMADVDHVIDVLRRIQKYGIAIAIDDFGTGYSSLQYLQDLPLNTLKIDRAFVTDLDNRDASSSLANTIVQLAKLHGLRTVAEGVETAEQDAKIRSMGVDYIQGFYYSKPVSANEIPGVLTNIEQWNLTSKTA